MQNNAYIYKGEVLFFEDEISTYMPKGWTADAIIPPDDDTLKIEDYYDLLILCKFGGEGASHKYLMNGLSKTDKRRKEERYKALADAGIIKHDRVKNRYYAFFNTCLDEDQRQATLDKWSKLADEMLPQYLEENAK